MGFKAFKLFVGLVGLPGAGKTTLARILADKLTKMDIVPHKCKLSDRMRARAVSLGIPLTRDSISKVSLDMRNKYGQDYWAKILLEDLEKASFDIALVEGIWVIEELSFLKKKLEEKFILIGLDVTKDILFKRIRDRLQDLDEEEKQGEIRRVTEIIMSFVIEKFIELSDIVVLNNTNEISNLEQVANAIINQYCVVRDT